MNLANLMHLAVSFNIDPTKLGFSGQHDVVYLDLNEEDRGFLPSEDEFSEWSNEAKEAFSEEHGIWVIEECWGFYT